MGKFDDAIEVLKSNVEGNAHVGIPAVAKDYCEKVQAAIRILEAAGKVDKERAIVALHEDQWWIEIGDKSDPFAEVENLLAALPDKEDE